VQQGRGLTDARGQQEGRILQLLPVADADNGPAAFCGTQGEVEQQTRFAAANPAADVNAYPHVESGKMTRHLRGGPDSKQLVR
jgi:hypothetical protein